MIEHTPERMVPETYSGPAFWEHVMRYRFACRYVRGLDALDIACGEGYGTAALSKVARSCVGVDCAPDVVAHARSKYGIDARTGQAESIPLENASVDVVVTFETIEHIAMPEVFLAEISRVLRPGGLAIVSTPNKPLYNEGEPPNRFHLSEMDHDNFVALLKKHFVVEEVLGQSRGKSTLDHIQAFLALLSNTLAFRLRVLAERAVCAMTPARARDTKEARAFAIAHISEPSRFLYLPWHPNAVCKVHDWTRRPFRYMIALARKPL